MKPTSRMKPTIKINSAGARAILRSPEVLADLSGRAARIARAAGPGNSHSSTVGHSRALAMVWTSTADARANEARHNTLTRAIDAGR